jgi:TldD protein
VDLADRALGTASRLGARYADVRWVEARSQTVTTRNGTVSGLAEDVSSGLGVRVLVDGAWGFAARSGTDPEADPEAVDRLAAAAVAIARASARVPGAPVDLGPEERHVDRYVTPVATDPFSVPIDIKIETLLAADRLARAVPDVAVVRGSLVAIREDKRFASSEGSRIEQTLFETGGGLEVLAVGHGDSQKRSYPNSFGRHQGTLGWELVTAMDLAGNARRIAEEAAALLTAKPCAGGVTTIILDGTQVALQVHESCGHPIELDRVFGTEAAFAGTSFLTPDKLGHFRYGSERVNLTADATLPGGLGTFGYDDEGVPAQRTPIVRQGTFVGYMTSRETASRLHGLHPGWPERSNGTMRASGWNRIPLIRMTNVSLEPGEGSLEDLIADTEDGLLMQTNKSWSIDDRRLNFQFGTEIAWEIKRGRRGAMIKNATYTGMTPEFWAGCDAVCGPDAWVIWGTPNCGKGQPGQIAHTGHGAAPARFRNVRVGVV